MARTKDTSNKSILLFVILANEATRKENKFRLSRSSEKFFVSIRESSGFPLEIFINGG